MNGWFYSIISVEHYETKDKGLCLITDMNKLKCIRYFSKLDEKEISNIHNQYAKNFI